MSARTIPWETIADWYKENEQAIRDVMKFEGLRGAVNEVLRLAPEQPELAALREELAKANGSRYKAVQRSCRLRNKLDHAEQRNASHEDMLRHFASCADVRQVGTSAMEYVAALTKPTGSGASE